MATIIFVAVCAWLGGMGLTYIMMAGIIQAERRRAEGYPAIRDEQPPIPVCHPDRHNQLTGAYQDVTQEIRQPAPVSRYNVIDRFAYLEVQQ